MEMGKLLGLGLLAGIAALAFVQYPELKRYFNMSRM